MEHGDSGSEENTVNPRYNGPGCTGQNMAVRNCKFLEILQLEGFVVRKLFGIKKNFDIKTFRCDHIV
jgi:hypothetical protein